MMTRFLLCCLSSFILTPLFSSTQTKQYHSFATTLHHTQGLNTNQTISTLQNIQFLPKIITIMDHPAESKPWNWYQQFFVTSSRINAGADYWGQHELALSQAHQQYGVDPAVIVAIIGVETGYGKYKGNYRAIDTLGTLAFHYPKRARYFKQELGEYLLLTHEQHLDPLSQHSSYAGALGIPQFMPSSYRRYAVHTHHEKNSDLFHRHTDAILSIADFLQQHGWRKGTPVALPVNASANSLASATNKTQDLAWFQQHQIISTQSLHNHNLPGKVTFLDPQHQKHPWVTLPNFNAILSYNHSNNYAMAVWQLALAIKKRHAYDQRQATTS